MNDFVILDEKYFYSINPQSPEAESYLKEITEEKEWYNGSFVTEKNKLSFYVETLLKEGYTIKDYE